MSGSKIERITVNLPANFDARRHTQAVLAKIADKHGEGWEVESIDSANNRLTATRYAQVTETSTVADDTLVLGLARGTKPSDGEKIAAKFEDAHPGFRLTKFDPYLGQATMTRLPAKVVRAREAVRVALGVKPWDVQVRATRDGGFEVELPPSYVPSKHDDKLLEVAEEVIGRPGWFVTTDPAKLTAKITPADPPTFPAAIAYPRAKALISPSSKEAWSIPFGVALGREGREGHQLALDFDATPGLLVVGTAGSGKAEALTNRVPVPVSERHPDGWAEVGNMKVGDEVYTPSGHTARIAGFSDTVVRELYDVHLSDGQVVRVAGDHLWKVSSHRSRTNHYQREPEGVREARRAAKRAHVDRILAVAARTKVGTYGTVEQIAELTGVPAARVYRCVNENAISCEQVVTNFEGGTFSTRKVTRYEAEPIARAFTEEGFGTALDIERARGRWVTPREMAVAIGLGSTKSTVRKVRDRMKASGAATMVATERVPHVASLVTKAVNTYPVAEVATLLAEVYDTSSSFDVEPLMRVVTTDEMRLALHARASHRNWAVRVHEGISGTPTDLPVEPYILGMWLGDGTARNGGIAVGPKDRDEVTSRITELWGPPARVETKEGTDAVVLHLGPPADGRTDLSLSRLIRRFGLFRNKHIPAVYKRAAASQRLHLLQGLMDADGSIDAEGGCELTLSNERLATDALELVRSLGIKASMRSAPAAITEEDPAAPGRVRRRVVGTRWRIHFTTTREVFRLRRKASQLPASTRTTSQWLYVTDIIPVGRQKARCLRVDSPDGMYLTAGFVPTHNSVSLNAMITGALERGFELAIGDVPHKAVDFTWVKKYCRPGGFGCASPEATLTMLRMVYEEGQRRADLLAEHDVQKVQDLPAALRPAPILVVLDEVTGMFALEDVPKGIPKDHPLVQEALQKNLVIQMIKSTVAKIPAELRFVGVRIIVATQMAQANTGISVPLKTNLANRMLLGANPNDAARGHAFLDPRSAPQVPEHIKADRVASRGVGVAELEGVAPEVFKSFFASTSDYAEHLDRLGVPTTSQPEPTPSQIAQYTPSLDDDGSDDRTRSRLDSEGGWGERDGRDVPDPRLRGAAAAAHQLRVEAAQAARGR